MWGVRMGSEAAFGFRFDPVPVDVDLPPAAPRRSALPASDLGDWVSDFFTGWTSTGDPVAHTGGVPVGAVCTGWRLA